MRRNDRREVRKIVGGAFLDIGNYILRKDRRSMKRSELGKKIAKRSAKVARIYTREFEEEGKRVIKRVARDGKKVVKSARRATRGRFIMHA